MNDQVPSVIPLSLHVYPALVFDMSTVVCTSFPRSFFFLYRNTNIKPALNPPSYLLQ